MKNSVVHGRKIYENINSLYKEINELEKALDTLGDEFGQMSLPYKLIDKQRKDKVLELTKALNFEYVIDGGL